MDFLLGFLLFTSIVCIPVGAGMIAMWFLNQEKS